jgi:hypothetical protein
MISETLDLIREVFGVEKKQLLAQLDLSPNGLKYIKEHPISDKKSPRQVVFYNLVRSYLDDAKLKSLGPVVKNHFLVTLRERISGMPENIHRQEVLTVIERCL